METFSLYTLVVVVVFDLPLLGVDVLGGVMFLLGGEVLVGGLLCFRGGEVFF